MTIPFTILGMSGGFGAQIMNVIDLLDIANRIAGGLDEFHQPVFQPRIFSIDGHSLKLSNGYQISVDGSLQDAPAKGVLYLPAFPIASEKDLHSALERWREAIEWLRHEAHKYELVVACCSANFLLAEAGLVEGKKATTCWWMSQMFTQRYPNVELEVDQIYIESDKILSGGSTTASNDVSLRLVERYGSRRLARLLAKYMLLDNQRSTQAPYAILSLIHNDDPVVFKAEKWIRENLQTEIRISQLAEHCAVSTRTLVRRFQNSLGESPQSVIQRFRIEKSKMLLETTRLPLSTIIHKTGYNDESAFRRLFKKYCQLSPRDYRRRFNKAYRDESEHAA